MIQMSKLVFVVGLVGAAIGCYSDRPHDVGQMRPPIDDLDRRDRGLQSRDVVEASDRVVEEILALPDFNQHTRQTIVVTNVENDTTHMGFNYDIFIRRLST